MKTKKQIENEMRKQKRKNIICWYKFLKRELQNNISVSISPLITCEFLPCDGRDVAARLLCRKNKNYEIENGKFMSKYIKWK